MIVIDIETTGLDPKKNSIVEIGALDFNNPNNRFYQKCKIFDGAEIDINALKINGYNNIHLNDKSKQELKDLILNLIEWIKPIKIKTFAGQNVDFDISFLKESLYRYNISWHFGWRTNDLHTLAYCDYLKKGFQLPIKYGYSDFSGDKIMEYVGLPSEPRPHSGINGAIYEAEAFSRLIYGKLLINDFKKNSIPSHLHY